MGFFGSDLTHWYDSFKGGISSLMGDPSAGLTVPRPSTDHTSGHPTGGSAFQYPAGGGAAVALPAGGLQIVVGRRKGQFNVGRLSNITFVVVSGGTATFQYWDHNDTPSSLATVTAGNGYHTLNRHVQSFQVLATSGTPLVALQLNDPPGDIDVVSLLYQSNPSVNATIVGPLVTTSHGQVVATHDQGA